MVLKLKYKGQGFIAGIPARDLTDEDIEALPGKWSIEDLLAYGIYERVKQEKKTTKMEADEAPEKDES